MTIKYANVLVVDEADRLIEANHYEELESMFNWLRFNSDLENPDADEKTFSKLESLKHGSRFNKFNKSNSCTLFRQTLVFSATLTFVHSGALKPGTGSKKRKIGLNTKKTMTTQIKLGKL